MSVVMYQIDTFQVSTWTMEGEAWKGERVRDELSFKFLKASNVKDREEMAKPPNSFELFVLSVFIDRGRNLNVNLHIAA